MLHDLLEYWKTTAVAGDTFHPDDRDAIRPYQHNLPEGRIPEPWFGIPSKAKVFYLTPHPGHKDGQSTKEPWRRFCSDMMLEDVSYDRYLKEAPDEAKDWLRKNHGRFADKDIFPKTFPGICNLRLIAYPSTGMPYLGKTGGKPNVLPSSELMMKCVHEKLVPLARANKILLLVMQSLKSWGFEVGNKTENYWDGGFFAPPPVRKRSLSPKSKRGDIDKQISSILDI